MPTMYGKGKTIFEENLERIMAQAKSDPNWVYKPTFKAGLTIEEEEKLKRYSGILPAENKAVQHVSTNVSTNEIKPSDSNGNTYTIGQMFEQAKQNPMAQMLEQANQNPVSGTTGNTAKNAVDTRIFGNKPTGIKEIDDIRRAQNKKDMEELSEKVVDLSKKHKALGTAMNLGLSLAAPSSAVEAANQFIRSLADKNYKPDPYADGMMPVIAQKATEEGLLDGQ